MTWDEALRAAARRLNAVGIDGAHRDARRLLAHTLGCEPGQVTLHGDREAPDGLRSGRRLTRFGEVGEGPALRLAQVPDAIDQLRLPLK